ncbi:MAG TPA: hypothetical protein VFA85_18930 [Terriglobales bacterium]|nr:hypothetical protein [Terriglobales bacterium]
MHRTLLAFAVAFLTTGVVAQTRFGNFRRSASIGPGRTVVRAHRPFFPATYYPIPYFYSDLYDPYEIEYSAPEPPPRPEPIIQVKTEPIPDPVLLELHGDQWVKVPSFSMASDHALAKGTSAKEAAARQPLPPAVLVFRDGHREEITSYSIIGDSIHAKSDYWTTGSWNRTIPVAALNIPATLAQNRDRGVNFELPSSPDEIMIRP